MSGGLCLYEGLFGITGFVIGQRTAEYGRIHTFDKIKVYGTYPDSFRHARAINF